MRKAKAAEYAKSDPEAAKKEKEFSIGFAKPDEMATVDASIRSMIKRLLLHSDFIPEYLTVYDEDENRYRNIEYDEFEGEGSIVFVKGKIPIESLKINSSPRSTRSYAQIVSPQEQVNIDND